VAGAQGKTVVFFPEGAFGPTNNCVGIVEVLRRRGHRVIFVIEKSFVGTLEEKGFEERLMRLAPRPEVEEEPGQFWKDFIRETAPVFRKSTFDQLGEFIAPTWQALLDGARCVDERLVEIFDEVQPDAIVEDNVCAFPAIPASGRPWVRIVSCNPLELKDPELPPPFSELPIGDRSAWEDYRAGTGASSLRCRPTSASSAADRRDRLRRPAAGLLARRRRSALGDRPAARRLRPQSEAGPGFESTPGEPRQ